MLGRLAQLAAVLVNHEPRLLDFVAIRKAKAIFLLAFESIARTEKPCTIFSRPPLLIRDLGSGITCGEPFSTSRS